MRLDWKPQDSYREFFLTSKKGIINNRSVFRPDIEYFVPYGGRGSAKTWTFSDAVVVEATLRPVRVLVTREFQDSIEESIKAEIEAAIEKRDLHHFFDVQNNVITAKNGSRFIFKGLKNNIKNLKSIADVDIVLAEEAENITKNSWDKLLPSIRPKDKVTRNGSPIIIVIFNPDEELDDTYQRYVVSPPPNCISKLLNFYDNKYFPEHLDRQRIHFKKTRPLKDYEHEWKGKPKGGSDDVIIDLEWIKAARFASRHPGFKKAGKKSVGFDISGQGKDTNAAVFVDGNILTDIDEWLKSPDLREATLRGMAMVTKHGATVFRFDECGGFGDGAAVFVDDEVSANKELYQGVEILPFNAGDAVVNPDDLIEGTDKTWGEIYLNAKAQAHGIVAQTFYNTFRFVVLGETGIAPANMISIDIEDNGLFNKLAKELSSPLWVKSKVNSKKRVEAKVDMEKRTGQKSPNIGDGFIMTRAPVKRKPKGFFDAFIDSKTA